jgi:hypothetical protein
VEIVFIFRLSSKMGGFLGAKLKDGVPVGPFMTNQAGRLGVQVESKHSHRQSRFGPAVPAGQAVLRAGCGRLCDHTVINPE